MSGLLADATDSDGLSAEVSSFVWWTAHGLIVVVLVLGVVFSDRGNRLMAHAAWYRFKAWMGPGQAYSTVAQPGLKPAKGALTTSRLRAAAAVGSTKFGGAPKRSSRLPLRSQRVRSESDEDDDDEDEDDDDEEEEEVRPPPRAAKGKSKAKASKARTARARAAIEEDEDEDEEAPPAPRTKGKGRSRAVAPPPSRSRARRAEQQRNVGNEIGSDED